MKDIFMVSLDSSTKKTGFGVYKNAVFNTSGLINFENIKDTEERMSLMLKSIFTVLNKYKPIIVAIEETKAPRNAQTQRVLTEILGAVRGWCLCNDAEFAPIPPSKWRKLVYGKDPANRDIAKQMAIDYVKENYSLDVSDDEAEGILVGLAIINDRLGKDFAA